MRSKNFNPKWPFRIVEIETIDNIRAVITQPGRLFFWKHYPITSQSDFGRYATHHVRQFLAFEDALEFANKKIDKHNFGIKRKVIYDSILNEVVNLERK